MNVYNKVLCDPKERHMGYWREAFINPCSFSSNTGVIIFIMSPHLFLIVDKYSKQNFCENR